MADQTITPIELTEATLCTDLLDECAALTTTNDGIVALPKDGKGVLLMKITTKGTTGTITLKAGDYFRKDAGDTELSTSAFTDDDWTAVVVESARYKDSDGNLTIDLGGSGTEVSAAFITLP